MSPYPRYPPATRLGKAVLGVLTAWPIAYLASSLVTWRGGRSFPPRVHAANLVFLLALLAFYLLHLARNPRLAPAGRRRRRILLVLGSLVVMPFYWVTQVWRERE